MRARDAGTRRRLMWAYVIAGLMFTLGFGAIVVGATHGIHVHSGKTKGIADLAGGLLALAFGVAVLTGRIRGDRPDDAPKAGDRMRAAARSAFHGPDGGARRACDPSPGSST